MTIDTKDLELVKKVTPKKQIIDFEILNDSLNDENKFRQKVQNLCGNQELPLVFPSLPLFIKGRNEGFVTNQEYLDRQLSLPSSLFNSNTYTNSLELRGPMEEILLAYEKERVKHGLSSNNLIGDGWTKIFKKNFNKTINQPIGSYEEKLEEELDRRETNLKYSKYLENYKKSKDL